MFSDDYFAYVILGITIRPVAEENVYISSLRIKGSAVVTFKTQKIETKTICIPVFFIFLIVYVTHKYDTWPANISVNFAVVFDNMIFIAHRTF